MQLGDAAVQKSRFSSRYTLLFIAALSFVTALILSTLSLYLKKPTAKAKTLHLAKEMLNAAHLPFDTPLRAQRRAKKTFKPIFVDDKGAIEKALSFKDPLSEPLTMMQQRLIAWEIHPPSQEKRLGYLIPIQGEGLWGPMLGFVAVRADGNTVIGISWVDHKETPGLGATMADPKWQKQFRGKKLFQTENGSLEEKQTCPLGLIVVKGKVQDVFADDPCKESAVDGITGATLTGRAITRAYREGLEPYRPFLMRLHENIK